MITYVPFRDATSVVPHGHAGVVNRLLVTQAEQGVAEVGVWHGTFEPGGASDVHVHGSSVQVYVVLSGRFVAGGPSERWTLEVNDTLIVPAGEPHFISCDEQSPGTVLVVSAPALR
ncbi:cupin domain-containing protein [Micromonospora sp. NPDC005113]